MWKKTPAEQGTTVPHGEFTSCGSLPEASFVEKSQIELKIILKSNTKAKDISDLADGINYRNMPPNELVLPTNSNLYVQDILSPNSPGNVTNRWIVKLIEQ